MRHHSVSQRLSTEAAVTAGLSATWPTMKVRSSTLSRTGEEQTRTTASCTPRARALHRSSTLTRAGEEQTRNTPGTPRGQHGLPPLVAALFTELEPCRPDGPKPEGSRPDFRRRSSTRGLTPRSSVSTAASERPKESDLRQRILAMKPAEVNRMMQQIEEFHYRDDRDGRDSRGLCHAFAHRVGELIRRTPLEKLGQAANMVLLIEEHPKLFAGIDVKGSFRHLLEVRLESLLIQSTAERCESDTVVELLIFKYQQASQLVSRGLVASKLQELALGNLHRWVEQAPLAQLQRQLPSVSKAAQMDQLLATTVAHRLAGMQLITLNVEQFKLVAGTLIDLQERGTNLKDAQIEAVLAKQLQTLVKAWPRKRLTKELQPGGGLLVLSQGSKMIQENIQSSLSTLLSDWLMKIIDSLRCILDLDRLEDEFAEWHNLAQLGIAAELVSFDATARDAFMDVFCSSLSRCVETQELRPAHEIINQMHWQVIVLVGYSTADDVHNDASSAATGILSQSMLPDSNLLTDSRIEVCCN